jgi:hypothetical protein
MSPREDGFVTFKVWSGGMGTVERGTLASGRIVSVPELRLGHVNNYR